MARPFDILMYKFNIGLDGASRAGAGKSQLQGARDPAESLGACHCSKRRGFQAAPSVHPVSCRCYPYGVEIDERVFQHAPEYHPNLASLIIH